MENSCKIINKSHIHQHFWADYRLKLVLLEDGLKTGWSSVLEYWLIFRKADVLKEKKLNVGIKRCKLICLEWTETLKCILISTLWSKITQQTTRVTLQIIHVSLFPWVSDQQKCAAESWCITSGLNVYV